MSRNAGHQARIARSHLEAANDPAPEAHSTCARASAI
jgi:hypothetical protein